MTIREAIASTINYPLPDFAIEKSMVDAGLDGNALYAKGDEKAVDLCTARLLFTVCTSGNISEGGYSISLPDRDRLLQIRSFLLSKWETIPMISDGSDLW